MDDLILRDASEVGRTAMDRFVWRCDDAFDRFVAAVEDRFGVHAKELKTSEEIESYGSLKDYPYFALIKDGVDTGYEISGYIKDDHDNDRLEIRYYASTADKKDWRESFEGEDVIAWLDDKMVKKESRRLRGRMLREGFKTEQNEKSKYLLRILKELYDILDDSDRERVYIEADGYHGGHGSCVNWLCNGPSSCYKSFEFWGDEYPVCIKFNEYGTPGKLANYIEKHVPGVGERGEFGAFRLSRKDIEEHFDELMEALS